MSTHDDELAARINPLTLIRQAGDALSLAYKAAQAEHTHESARAAIQEALALVSLALTALSAGGNAIVRPRDDGPEIRGTAVWTCEECGEKGRWESLVSHNCREPYVGNR